MDKNKYYLNVILSIALVALLLILTFKYVVKTERASTVRLITHFTLSAAQIQG